MEQDAESAVRELARQVSTHNEWLNYLEGVLRNMQHQHEARWGDLEDVLESLSDQLDSALQELRGAQGALEDRQSRGEWLMRYDARIAKLNDALEALNNKLDESLRELRSERVRK